MHSRSMHDVSVFFSDSFSWYVMVVILSMANAIEFLVKRRIAEYEAEHGEIKVIEEE